MSAMIGSKTDVVLFQNEMGYLEKTHTFWIFLGRVVKGIWVRVVAPEPDYR